MFKLIFLTSSQTKLAHARHLGEAFDIEIEGFRQKTYHANYNEPRIDSREELLDQSYKSAIEQCKKGKIPVETRFFILEDTSVRIDALSTEDMEFPGLDVKFWMQQTSFDELNKALEEAEGNRRVSVRSDIVLHIPEKHKRAWKLERNYLVFTGIQHGYIAKREPSFDGNLVYPWLDNQSFNKWFVPEGFSSVLGALSIDDADKVDFRAASFRKLVDFLRMHGFIPKALPTEDPPSQQLSMEFNRHPIVIFCGYTCAGKTTASQHLADQFGFVHVEASDFMYLSYYMRHGFDGAGSIGDFAEDALIERPQIAAELIARHLRDKTTRPIVVSGFRAQTEVDWLMDHFSATGRPFKVVFVHANQDLRYSRLNRRMREGDDVTFEKFQARDDQQTRMGLLDIEQDDRTDALENEGSLEAFYARVDQYVGQENVPVAHASVLMEKMAELTDVKLETAILITLLHLSDPDETRPYFTTTEIARHIQGVFPNIKPMKHKDNVSRYFNQDYYAYYEVAHNADDDKRRFRLSNTGLGSALEALRSLAETAY
ncbi:MAG: non-canonical purine NTP pyrophosphatase [Pseudomonadota bacterium]